MKKILPVFFILVVIFKFAGCSNIEESKGQSSAEKSTVSKNESTDENNKNKLTSENNNNQEDNTKELTSVKKIINMNITVGNTTFKATLEDNEAAKVFVKQLPLTVDMFELNGNEKYNYLPSDLRADTAASPGKISEGDLMLYGNNCLVLFYKAFNTSYSYVKLGHIENATDIDKALGQGNVKVTFSITE